MAAMATTSFPCTAALKRGPVSGRLPQQKRDGTAVSCNCYAWGTVNRVSNLELNLELKKLEFRFTTSYGGGAGCIRVPQSQRKGRIIAAISKLDDEFREGAETDGVGEEIYSVDDKDVGKSVQIDLQLPRRRLLVEFTCNVCQTRTQRLVNPDAYKRGTVYVQCGGCEAYHKLVDNLGLVVEYDFRKESDPDSS